MHITDVNLSNNESSGSLADISMAYAALMCPYLMGTLSFLCATLDRMSKRNGNL